MAEPITSRRAARLASCRAAAVALVLAGCASGTPGSRPPEAQLRYQGEPAALANCLGHGVVQRDACTGSDQRAILGVDPGGTFIFACMNVADPGLAAMAVGSAMGGGAGAGAFAAGAMSRSGSDAGSIRGTMIYSARLRQVAPGQTQVEYWVARPRVAASSDLALMKAVMTGCEKPPR